MDEGRESNTLGRQALRIERPLCLKHGVQAKCEELRLERLMGARGGCILEANVRVFLKNTENREKLLGWKLGLEAGTGIRCVH